MAEASLVYQNIMVLSMLCYDCMALLVAIQFCIAYLHGHSKGIRGLNVLCKMSFLVENITTNAKLQPNPTKKVIQNKYTSKQILTFINLPFYLINHKSSIFKDFIPIRIAFSKDKLKNFNNYYNDCSFYKIANNNFRNELFYHLF